jgi:hypothetical protein
MSHHDVFDPRPQATALSRPEVKVASMPARRSSLDRGHAGLDRPAGDGRRWR